MMGTSTGFIFQFNKAVQFQHSLKKFSDVFRGFRRISLESASQLFEVERQFFICHSIGKILSRKNTKGIKFVSFWLKKEQEKTIIFFFLTCD